MFFSHFADQEIHIRDYFYIFKKRKTAASLFFLAVLFGGIFLTYSQTVLYRAQATLLIERENPRVVNFQEVVSLDASISDYYRTQYQLLESRSLIEKLIEENGLYQDAYFQGIVRGHPLRQLMAEFNFLPIWFRKYFIDPSPYDAFIKKMLSVEPVLSSQLVRVGVMHPDPKKSSELTNALVNIFIRDQLKNRFLSSMQATELISDRLSELKEKVAKAERELQEYKEKNQLFVIPNIYETDVFFQDAKLELVKLQSKEGKLATRYLPAHPKMIHIKSQIQALRDKIDEEEVKQFKLSRIAIQYGELEREAKTARQIYEALLKRLEETQSEAETQASNIVVVDAAKAPARPYKPNLFLSFFLIFSIGILGGILFAFFIEYLDFTVRIPDDIEKGLGLHLLGIIPKARQKSGKDIASKHLFISTPNSISLESIRALRTAILFQTSHAKGARAILVTSPNPEEGKSTVVFNLAAVFQQNHCKVLLMDADLRKPKLHTFLQIQPKEGLSDVLDRGLAVEEVIQKNVQGLGFDFLSCGSPSDHPTEILHTEKMRGCIEKLKEIYDVILCDTPPYLAVADVAVLSDYMDAVLIVARYHKTDKRHLKNIEHRLRGGVKKLIGVVLNQVSVREKDYYFQQYYYYGYGDSQKKT